MASPQKKKSGLTGRGAISRIGDTSCVLGKSAGPEDDLGKLLQHVFQLPDFAKTEKTGSPSKSIDFGNLAASLDSLHGDYPKHSPSGGPKEPVMDGKIGPALVCYDVQGNSGTMLIESDKLGVTSHSNFSTIRANCCFYKGRWQYEVMLGSKGVMQVGWCTISCKFSQEEGVGDTQDSYAYDGNRVRKWNKETVKYGEPWLTGDVITCAIDCDEGTVTYARNGNDMGVAFINLRLGPGIAYFPAVSLSAGENLQGNFGATPLRYPFAGYRPLQDPPTLDLVKAQQLFGCLDRLLPIMVEEDMVKRDRIEDPLGATTMTDQDRGRSRKGTLALLSAHLLDKLGKHMQCPFTVEACLLSLMFRYTEPFRTDQIYIHKLLDMMWMFMQDFEVQKCLERVIISLTGRYRFSPSKPDFKDQEVCLILVLALLQHDVTRRHLIKNVLFDKGKFPIFMHIKPLDDVGFTEVVKTPWWGFIKQEDEKIPPMLSLQEESDRRDYVAATRTLRAKVQVLEDIQTEMMKLLLTDTDGQEGASTRFVFLHKLREFLKENSPMASRVQLMNQCPLPVSLCFFHRLIRAVRACWDTQHPSQSHEASVPCNVFYSDTINYFEIHRVGGLYSHLRKFYRSELYKAHGDMLPQVVVENCSDEDCGQTDQAGSGDASTAAPVSQPGSHVEVTQQMAAAASSAKDDLSLVEVVDGVIMLYHVAAHKQLGKMNNLRDGLKDYATALDDAENKLKNCPPELPDVKEELARTRDVFLEKVMEHSRHMAWVKSVIYSKDKQEDVYWVLQVTLRSLLKASSCENLFSFTPDFYVDVCINAYNALRGYFHPTISYETLPGFSDTVNALACFLCDHFADSRVVNADVKDTLVQALACFVCYPQSLAALEKVPRESQERMIKALLAPYENRAWAQTNWILVRLWKGCGFGFRYIHLPHLVPVKHQQQEMGTASLQKPCPSIIYQGVISDLMHNHEEMATKFIDSLLKQLNWAFSEFIGMLQELQSLATQHDTHYIDSRQLKICATCFDISVGLMRVMEMIVNLCPKLLTDFKGRPSAEVLLARLFQCVCQVMNRVTARMNLFETVVNLSMPGLETVDHFPILTAVAGILVALLGNEEVRDVATGALLAEPSFQPNGLEFLLGTKTEGQEAGATAVVHDRKNFSLRKYKEVSEEEVTTVEQMVEYVQQTQNETVQKTAEISEDNLCSICYARAMTVKFQPCGHTSCKPCILHHVMTKKQCFFCMKDIETLMDADGHPIRLI